MRRGNEDGMLLALVIVGLVVVAMANIIPTVPPEGPVRLSPEGTSPTPPGCYPPECSPCPCGPTCDCMLGLRVEIPGTNQHYHIGMPETECQREKK